MDNPMTTRDDGKDIDAIKSEARALGFTHVRTHGGSLPLENWNPYGMCPGEGGTNYDPIYYAKRPWRGIIMDGAVLDGLDAQPPLVGGRWPLERVS